MADLVTLEINGKDFAGWESLTITRTLDSCADAFSLSAPFDPVKFKNYASFRPFGYQSVRLKIDDEKILTGRIESVSPSISASDRMINVQGRSLTGSLVDCSIDGQGFNFKGLSLSQIAKKLCSPFSVSVVSISEAELPLMVANASPGQSVFDFLNQLAKDLSLLLTCNADGNLVITKVLPGGKPVDAIIEGERKLLSANGSFDGTKIFSAYKVLMQQDGKNDIMGKALDGSIPIYRPLTSTGSDADAKDVQKSAEWKRALAISGAVGLSVTMAGWRTSNGLLWSPGQVVTLKAPGAFILKESPFLISEASLTLDTSQGKTSALKLVLPATYSGKLPEVYPWV